MKFQVLFIDLDDTVYPASCGLWAAIRGRIDLYMQLRMGFSPEEIPGLRRQLYKTYGTTMLGLKATYAVDERDYLDFVHDVPLDDYLSKDPVLRQTLASYPLKRFIFTNADRGHAQRVLEKLDILDLFDQIIDIMDIQPYCKPMPEAFKIALQHAGEPDPSHCVFLDDSPVNLAGARNLGFYTIRVGKIDPSPEYHAAINVLNDLPQILPPNGQVTE
jgi:putative hydrolase of the HAD superfamily